MTTVQAEKIARRKLSLLQIVQELANVSEACRTVGYSCPQFYEIPRSFRLHGADGLVDRLTGGRGLIRTAFRHRPKRRSWPTRWSTRHTGPGESPTN